MKLRLPAAFARSLALPATVTVTLLGAPLAHAANFFKANNATNLNSAASWLDDLGVQPAAAPDNSTSSSHVLIWDNRVTAENIVSMGNNIGCRTLRILDPDGPVTINGTHTLTFSSTGGIDMSNATQNLTFNTSFYRIASSNASITNNVAAGHTLTLNGELTVRNDSSGATVSHPGAGTAIYNGPFRASFLTMAAGEVQLNAPAGSSRFSTNSTTVNGGKLVINNTSGSATGSGAVTINNAGTITGQGIISGGLTVNSGATLAPGNGIGSLQAGSLTLAAGSVIHWEGIDAVNSDLIKVTADSGLAINGGTLHLFNPGTTDPFTGVGVFNLFSFTGSVVGLGNLQVAESSKIEGQTYTIGLSEGFVTLTVEVGNRPESFWNVDADENWTTAGNWTDNLVPNEPLFIANLGGDQGISITQPTVVTLDTDATTGVLNFDSVEPFTIGGNGTLFFDDGVAAGRVQVKEGSHTIGVPVSLPPAGLFVTVEQAADTLTIADEILEFGNVTIGGPGTVVLAADHYFTGNLSNGVGTLQIGTGGTTGSVLSPIANAGTLRFNRSDNYELFSPVAISGTGHVDFAGTGITTLFGPNTHSGDTTVSAGGIIISDAMALQNTTLVHSATGGTVAVGSVSSVTLGGLSGNANFPLTNEFASPIDLAVGQNNRPTSYSGSGVGTGATFTKAGTGALTLSGTLAFTGDTSVTAGTLELATGANFTTAAANVSGSGSARLLVSGGTLHSSASSLMANATGGISVTGGTANFNGGITTPANFDTAAALLQVTGGTLNAASIGLSRGNLNIGAEPGTGQTGNGLYINGGAVAISGALNIGNVSGANSSVSTRMDSGSLTVNGPITVGINNTGRWSVLDIAGGVFTSTDAVTGLQIGSGWSGNAVAHVRGTGTVATVERVKFGQADLTGSLILNLSGGALYVGSGGMTVGSTNPALSPRLRLNGGLLGATADWTADVPVSLNGTANITAADALGNPHAITFNGPVNGTGGLIKSGAGSVDFTSPSISFAGTVSVQSGSLGIGGQTGAVTVLAGAKLKPLGTLNAQAASTVDGTLAVHHDSGAGISPGRIHSLGTLTLGATSALEITGNGPLTGAVHVLASAAGGISGTFGSVGPIPDGYALNDNFDDGSAFPVVALVSTSASPYSLWASSFGLNGAAAAGDFDADNDGVRNLVEFGLGLNPTLSDGPGPVLGRSGNFLTLTFDHIAGGGITFAIEADDGLDGWEIIHTYPPFAAAGTEVFTDNVAIGSGTKRFLRLRVVAAP